MAENKVENKAVCVFFWKKDAKWGVFCQWKNSVFLDEDTKYHNCEQFMMAEKAMLFMDKFPRDNQKVLEKIMKSTSPKAIKALGRQIRGFKEKIWKKHRYEIVVRGNLLKFSQNKDVLEKLLSTGEKNLIEASPMDRIWGIGYEERNALAHMDNWGSNLLGLALMDVRKQLRK